LSFPTHSPSCLLPLYHLAPCYHYLPLLQPSWLKSKSQTSGSTVTTCLTLFLSDQLSRTRNFQIQQNLAQNQLHSPLCSSRPSCSKTAWTHSQPVAPGTWLLGEMDSTECLLPPEGFSVAVTSRTSTVMNSVSGSNPTSRNTLEMPLSQVPLPSLLAEGMRPRDVVPPHKSWAAGSLPSAASCRRAWGRFVCFLTLEPGDVMDGPARTSRVQIHHKAPGSRAYRPILTPTHTHTHTRLCTQRKNEGAIWNRKRFFRVMPEKNYFWF